ncbi:MAG TPA: hypothetical protein VKA73_16525 [Rubrobacter sp.]|nr:hypothetical protein [Rubrobacter sp.]
MAEEQGGLQPRYRRAFGCVTWLYMSMLTFLAANFFISLPFRYYGGEEIYNYVPPTLAYVGTVLLVPGMVFAAVLGARTYRAPRRVAGRVGAGVGALVGLSGFLSLVWISAALGFAERDQAFKNATFAEVGGVAFYLFVPLTLVATVLVVVALYSKGVDAPRRWRLGLVGAGLAVLAGVGLVLSDPSTVGFAAVLISTVSAAVAGSVGGAGGYARAGGAEMIPPGSDIRPRA